MDIAALKAAALASLSRKKQNDSSKRRVILSSSGKPSDELAALRAAALQTKARKADEESSDDSSPTTAVAPSKFSRHDDELESEDGSEISILEEIEVENSDNELYTSDLAGVPSAAGIAEEAMPDLLEGGVDITEFDDDDLLSEEETVPPLGSNSNITIGSSDRRSTDTRTTRISAAGNSRSADKTHIPDRLRPSRRPNGLSGAVLDDSQANGHRNRRRPSPLRQRSRSPRSRRSRSPRLQKPRFSQRRRTPPPPPPLQHRSPPSRSTAQSARVHSPHAVKQWRPNEDDNHTQSRDEMLDQSRTVGDNEADITPPVPDPTDDPSLTEEQRQTLINRKQKFSKTRKVSSTKKTIKLKKVKKKVSITKRLGAKKPKAIKSKSKTPEIVETVSLEVEHEEPGNRTSTDKVVKRAGIKARLGGYSSSREPQVPERQRRRLVSVNKPPDMSDEDEAPPPPRVRAESPPSTRSPTPEPPPPTRPLVRELKVAPTRRNVWSSRSPEPEGTRARTRGETSRGDRRDRGDVKRQHSKTAQPIWSAGRSDEADPRRPSADLAPAKSESQGKSQSEKELDERIRKIQEKNAKLERRQKEIEEEKMLYS